MAFNLPETTIRQRLLEWRNYKRLHAEQKERNRKLERELRELKIKYAKDIAERDALIEKLMLRIGDLEKMVFGEKKKNKDKNKDSSSGQSSSTNKDNKKPNKRGRSTNSYQRSTPPENDVTDTEHHTITLCPHCRGPLSRMEEVIRYAEDIILPRLLEQTTKTVTKHVIERGYCRHCGIWPAAENLRGQITFLGPNVKLLVTYLTTILDCSYEQVKILTYDLYGLTISNGEITRILREKAGVWQPEYEQLKEEIRAGPAVHLDETTWDIQVFAKHCYAWVMSAVNSPARVYKLAKSRGKDHARELLGNAAATFVRITDCYPAYKNLPGLHQICWAHLYRKIRDLKDNDNVPRAKQAHVHKWHDDFKRLYADLRRAVAEPHKPRRRQRQEKEFHARLEQLRRPHRLDPKPLTELKNLLSEYDHALFTCLQFDNIPCDNNRAERDIRILVNKRKKSFGSKTEAGAHTMEILFSVAWTTWYKHRDNFLPELAKLNKTT